MIDPWLSPFKEALKRRFSKATEWIDTINATEGGLDKFSQVRCPLPVPREEQASSRAAR